MKKCNPRECRPQTQCNHVSFTYCIQPFCNTTTTFSPSFTDLYRLSPSYLKYKKNLITQKQVTKGQNVCNKGHQSSTSKVCESNRAGPISRAISSHTTPLEGDSKIKPRMHVLFCCTAVAL